MSQVYSELSRLARVGYVEWRDDESGRRRARRYRISAEGTAELRRWLTESPVEFPVLKHPVALRLLLGHLVDDDITIGLLDRYISDLDEQRTALQAVRDGLGDDPAFRFPAQVAEWGLAYYDDEAGTAADIAATLRKGSPPSAGSEPADDTVV